MINTINYTEINIQNIWFLSYREINIQEYNCVDILQIIKIMQCDNITNQKKSQNTQKKNQNIILYTNFRSLLTLNLN